MSDLDDLLKADAEFLVSSAGLDTQEVTLHPAGSATVQVQASIVRDEVDMGDGRRVRVIEFFIPREQYPVITLGVDRITGVAWRHGEAEASWVITRVVSSDAGGIAVEGVQR